MVISLESNQMCKLIEKLSGVNHKDIPNEVIDIIKSSVLWSQFYTVNSVGSIDILKFNILLEEFLTSYDNESIYVENKLKTPSNLLLSIATISYNALIDNKTILSQSFTGRPFNAYMMLLNLELNIGKLTKLTLSEIISLTIPPEAAHVIEEPVSIYILDYLLKYTELKYKELKDSTYYKIAKDISFILMKSMIESYTSEYLQDIMVLNHPTLKEA